MSTNLDLVRSIYADWERGDYSANAWADPEIEWVMAEGPTPGRRQGLDGMAAGFREFLTAWTDFRQEAEDYREVDREHIVVFTLASGLGKTSGMDLAGTWAKAAAVFQIRGGKVMRLVLYVDRQRALADLGLAPEGKPKHAKDIYDESWIDRS
jgi:ketosteroid isomerase-like protein